MRDRYGLCRFRSVAVYRTAKLERWDGPNGLLAICVTGDAQALMPAMFKQTVFLNVSLGIVFLTYPSLRDPPLL
ncbi:MAG: hypothetical protein D6791_15495 [Chloroflexi bacterium]|nr:MAG: hypothetical protein D6791_15495 [Chloroflexota bacterium]